MLSLDPVKHILSPFVRRGSLNSGRYIFSVFVDSRNNPLTMVGLFNRSGNSGSRRELNYGKSSDKIGADNKVSDIGQEDE
jgi:hypothetical protein